MNPNYIKQNSDFQVKTKKSLYLPSFEILLCGACCGDSMACSPCLCGLFS